MEPEKKKENRRTSSSSSTSSSYATVTSGVSPTRRATNHAAVASRQRGQNEENFSAGAPVPDQGHTTTTDGALRNHFTVDILQMNGVDFKGRISPVVALKLIFVQALGFAPTELAGIIPGFKGNPTLLFKTKTSFNIDETFKGKSNFSFIRRVEQEDGEIAQTYDCSIRGVRVEGSTSHHRYTWVKVEGAEYQVEPETIRKWLLNYGTLMTELTEDKVDFDVSSDEEELYQGVELKTGIYSIQMEIKDPIPQFLPIDGKRIKIYHKGIKKWCTNCFKATHLRMACTSQRIEWLEYVDRFMVNNNLDNSYYGKWLERVDDWRLKNPEKHGQHVRDRLATVAEGERKSEENRNTARRIIEEQMEKETSATNCSRRDGEKCKQSEGSPGDMVLGGEVEAEKSKASKPSTINAPKDLDTVEEHQTDQLVAKAIEDMTFEEFKEIKRGRGRPPKEDIKKKKNSLTK